MTKSWSNTWPEKSVTLCAAVRPLPAAPAIDARTIASCTHIVALAGAEQITEALGTGADLVPLDQNNRVLVAQGMSRLRRNMTRPGIRALFSAAGRPLPVAGRTLAGQHQSRSLSRHGNDLLILCDKPHGMDDSRQPQQ